MVNVVLVISLFGILFVGFLGVYAFAYKIMRDMNIKLGEIYQTVNTHVQNTAVHLEPEHPVVTGAVCVEVQKKNEVHFVSLRQGQERIEKLLIKAAENT